MTVDAPRGALGDSEFRRAASHAIATPLGSLLLQAELIEHLIGHREYDRAGAAAQGLVSDCEAFAHMLREVFAAMTDMGEEGEADADPRACLAAALSELDDLSINIDYQGDAPRVALAPRALEALLRRIALEGTNLGVHRASLRGRQDGVWLSLTLCGERSRAVAIAEWPFGNAGGLNLWTAREIAVRHGGDLTVDHSEAHADVLLDLRLPIVGCNAT